LRCHLGEIGEILSFQPQKLEELTQLVDRHSPQEGLNYTRINNLGTYRASATLDRTPAMEIPGIVIVVSGKKACYLGDETHSYEAGKVLVGFYPVPAEMEIVSASPEEPYLLAGIYLDMNRMADVLLRIDRFDETAPQPMEAEPSVFYALDLSDDVLNAFIRIFAALDSPRDAAILGESMIDEIYYRLLISKQGGELRALLQQKGKIQRISKAVDFIHANLDQPVSVEKLAEVVYMSRTAFYNNFRDVMQISPLQYAKSVKLHEAQRLIKEGKRVNEASFLVGYNNLGQFSREYKRQFGFAPSAT
jgi:AraC-like DNA-binding protein